MLIKLAALGALGYAGYKYLGRTRTAQPRNPQTGMAQGRPQGHDAVAGGPLSGQAQVQHSPDAPQAQGSRPRL